MAQNSYRRILLAHEEQETGETADTPLPEQLHCFSKDGVFELISSAKDFYISSNTLTNIHLDLIGGNPERKDC